MTYDESMNLQEWQRRVDGLRVTDPLLAKGGWHGYLNTDRTAGGPIHGDYALVRWQLPSVVVAHNDPDEVFRLARLLEEAISS